VSTADFEMADSLLAARVSEHRLAHSRSVASTAGLLAGVYGVPIEEAMLAGLLHDWDRELSDEELVAEAHRRGLRVSEGDVLIPSLLHGFTGARALPEVFPGISGEVTQAVERHTVGDVEMEPLDMVVYIADIIEENRRRPGLDDLREAVGTVGLTDLFALCYADSVAHVAKMRKYIPQKTVQVWNRYVARPHGSERPSGANHG